MYKQIPFTKHSQPMNVGDVMFLYNLIAYQEGYQLSALTLLFETMVNDRHYETKAYYDWLANVDAQAARYGTEGFAIEYLSPYNKIILEIIKQQ